MEEVTKVKDLIEQKVPQTSSGIYLVGGWVLMDLRSCITTPLPSFSIERG
jgi:hypothetical protein